MRKVSVIIPNYNHSNYLEQRIESVLGQTYPDFEVLILDDCSPDNSRDVIERYRQNPRVSIEYNDQNSGNTYLQWQKGISLTSSEYIWIAESDDYADRRFLEYLVARLNAHPKAGLAVSDSVIVDEINNEIGIHARDFRVGRGKGIYPFPVIHENFVALGRDYARRHMVPWNTIPNASAVLFRRSAFDAIGGPVTEMRLCGDWYTYCKILMQFDICLDCRALNFFRQHQSNVRTRTRPAIYMSEQRQVRSYVQQTLGVREKWRYTLSVLRFENELVIGDERKPPFSKVPLRRLLFVLGHAAKYGSLLLLYTLVVLTKECLALYLRAPLRQRSGE